MTGLDHIMDSTMTVPKDRNMLQQKKSGSQPWPREALGADG
jgi:hypothetical protein